MLSASNVVPEEAVLVPVFLTGEIIWLFVGGEMMREVGESCVCVDDSVDGCALV